MVRTRRKFLEIAGGISGVTLAGCTGNQKPADQSETSDTVDDTAEVTLHGIQGTTNSVFRVAAYQGYFEEAGVNLNANWHIAPGDLYSNIQLGEVDFFVASPMVTARAYLSGQENMRMLAPFTDDMKFIAGTDVENPLDLKGEKVATFSSSSSTHMGFRTAFDEVHNIDFTNYFNLVEVAPPAMVPQLRQGEVSAVTVLPPHSSKLLTEDDFHEVTDLRTLYREAFGHTFHLVDFGVKAPYWDQKGDTIDALVEASQKAAEDIVSDPQLLVESGFVEDIFKLEDQAIIDQAVTEVKEAIELFAGYGSALTVDGYLSNITNIYNQAVEYDYLDKTPGEDIFSILEE